ncbi:MAG: hypothetical protein KDA61_15840, partial [Planctomycetales bacterium]|nr:hypothetical protein [Planctomycetales bacterium]
MARFRRLRRTLFPFFPSGSQTREFRNRALRRLGLARTHEPTLVVDHPELRLNNHLRYAAADVVVQRGRLRFIQVGAYDGRLDDDLHDVIANYPCEGVLVEPQVAAFARLQERHADNPRLQLVNAAVDREPGERDFYMPSCRISVLSSFDRNHLL